MNRRRWVGVVLVAGGAIAGAAAAVLVLWARDPGPGPFARVRQGMTREEVVAAVGKPPISASGVALPDDVPAPPFEEWMAKDEHLLVVFGPDGRAVRVEATPAAPRPTVWGRVRSVFGL